MKRLKKIFFLVLVLLLLPNDVFAITVDEFYGQIDNSKFSSYYSNQIVHIENLYFNDNEVEISGYSFIPYQDNYGGEDGNIKTYVVAVNAPQTGLDWNEWGNATLDIEPSNGSIECKDTSKCYVMETKVEERDFWWARCTGAGCTNQSIITAYRLNNGFNNTVKCANSKVNVEDNIYESECLYHNVGFSATLNLKEILERFGEIGENNAMRFFIVTLNTDVLMNNKPGIGATYTEMYVPDDNCYYKDLNGNSVSCSSKKNTDENEFKGGEVNTNSFKFELKYKTTQLAFNARNVTPLKDDYSSVAEEDYYFYNVSFDSYFENFSLLNSTARFTGDVYNIFNYVPNSSQENEFIRVVNGVSGPIDDALYALHTFNVEDCSTAVDRDTGIINLFGGYSGQACAQARWWNIENEELTSDDEVYWAYANWVNIRGSFQISGIKEKVKATCENLYDSKSTSYYTDNTVKYFNGTNDTDSKVDCSIDNDKEVTLKQCSDNRSDNGAQGHSVKGTIYVKVPGATGVDCVDEGVVNDFVPIDITTNVLLYQEGYFRFNKITDDTIRAGKGFELVSSYGYGEKELNTLIYDALLEWYYFLWYEEGGKMYPFYNVTTSYREKNSGGSCSNVNPYKLLNDTTEFYYNNSINATPTTLEEAIFNAIDIAVQNRYYESDATEAINTNVTLSSGDSNAKTVSKSTELVPVAGKWVSLKENTNSRYFTFDNNNVVSSTSGDVKSGNGSYFSYVYTLPNAYISLEEGNMFNGVSYNYADILYTNDNSVDASKFSGVGNKYFVGLKYIDDEFPFELVGGKPSFIKEMDWDLEGTCSVKIDNGLFDDEGKPAYKYRSISLSNPFPKAEKSNGILVNVATNWIDWYNKNIDGSGTFSRFINTYDNGINYQIIMTKVDDLDANTVSVNDIKSVNDYYGKLTGFSKYGTGEFVTSNGYFSIVRGNNGYCGLGYFSNNCDVYSKTGSNYIS